MRKAAVVVFILGLLGGPLSTFANAGVFCDLQEKLGYENVRECEDYWP